MLVYKREFVLSYILKIVVMLSGLMFSGREESLYVIISLIYIANAIMRARFLKEKVFALSLIIEIGLASYMHHSYGQIMYMLYYSIIIDTIYLQKSDAMLACGLNLFAMLYFIRSYEPALIILLSAVYAIVYVLVSHIGRMGDKIKEVENLYDEIRKYSYELESARNRLIEYSKRVEHVVQLEERDRISREIHDTIGHNLTGLYMQSELALKVFETDKEEGMNILRSVKDNLRDSIGVMRDTVKRLKPQNYSGSISSIRHLIEEFEKKSGIVVHFSNIGAQYDISPNIAVLLYRNTQEALTNSARHGRAKNIYVSISFNNGCIELSVKDDGDGCGFINKGMGLSGMEERARLLGGEVEFTGEDGFKVVTRVPVGC